MLSPNVTRAERNSLAVESFLASHGPAVRQAVADRAAHLTAQGQPPPATEGLTTLLDNLLHEARESLTAADREHEAASTRAAALRQERDEATRRLRATFLQVKAVTEGTFGRGSLHEVLGLDDPAVEEDAVSLARQAGGVLQALRRPDLVLPPPRLRFATFDPEAIAAALEQDLEALRQALAEVEAQRQIHEKARLHRRARQRDLTRLVSHSTGLLDYLTRLGGRQELIRPLRRQVRRKRSAQEREEAPEAAGREGGGQPTPSTHLAPAAATGSAPSTHLAPNAATGPASSTHLAPAAASGSAPSIHLAPGVPTGPAPSIHLAPGVPAGGERPVEGRRGDGRRRGRHRSGNRGDGSADGPGTDDAWPGAAGGGAVPFGTSAGRRGYVVREKC